MQTANTEVMETSKEWVTTTYPFGVVPVEAAFSLWVMFFFQAKTNNI